MWPFNKWRQSTSDVTVPPPQPVSQKVYTYKFIPQDDVTAKEAAQLAFTALTLLYGSDPLPVGNAYFEKYPDMRRHFAQVGEWKT